MPVSPLAGNPVPADLLIDVKRLVSAYGLRRSASAKVRPNIVPDVRL